MDEMGTAALRRYIDTGLRPAFPVTTPQFSQRLNQHWPIEDLAARDRMVEEYLPLVRRLCRRFSESGEPPEDLFQVGCIGLLRAIEKYDSTRGTKFITYAVPVIVGEIKNYFRDHGWAVKVPRKLQSQKLAVQRAVDSLHEALARPPTVQEIMEATGFTQEEVFDTFEVGKFGRPLSLDAENNGDDSEGAGTLQNYLGCEDPQFDRLTDTLDLTEALTSLEKREKTIISLKFYSGLSQTEIGQRLGISQMHVSRLQRDALNKLKRELMR